MKNIKTGIDIGSSKTLIIVGELYDSGKSIKILGKVSVPSNGITKGKIVDGEVFSRSIKLGKERLETELGIKIKSATVGISGNDVKSTTTEIEYKLSEDEILITEGHCEQIFGISKEKVIKDEEQILAKEIYNYRLDDSGIMKSPIGKIGKKLEARVHLIKIKKTRVKKIIETLNKAEINVENLIYSGEAGSKAVLQTSDKVNGVALVDIGHGLTEITIFKNNRLISANIIPIGGMHYINDLKYILELNQEVIKSLLLELKVKDAGEKLTITYLEDGKSITKTYEVNYLRDIIDARTDEIVNYILKNIEASGYKEYIKNGIVLIGGVVNDYGILEKLKSQVNHNVKIGTTLNISGMNTELKKTSSASGMGVLLTALEEAYNDIKNETEEKQEKEKLKHKVEKKKTDEKLEVKEKKEKTKTKAKMIKPKLDSSKMDKLKKWLSNFI